MQTPAQRIVRESTPALRRPPTPEDYDRARYWAHWNQWCQTTPALRTQYLRAALAPVRDPFTMDPGNAMVGWLRVCMDLRRSGVRGAPVMAAQIDGLLRAGLVGDVLPSLRAASYGGPLRAAARYVLHDIRVTWGV